MLAIMNNAARNTGEKRVYQSSGYRWISNDGLRARFSNDEAASLFTAF